MKLTGNRAHIAPVAPIDDFYGVPAPLREAVGKTILECAARRIVRLPRSLGERNEGGEEENEIQVEAAEHLVQIDANVYFRRQASSERGFVHEGHALVLQ